MLKYIYDEKRGLYKIGNKTFDYADYIRSYEVLSFDIEDQFKEARRYIEKHFADYGEIEIYYHQAHHVSRAYEIGFYNPLKKTIPMKYRCEFLWS